MTIFALVEWLNVTDKCSMTTINTSWIRNFDPLDVNRVESYVCEWRDEKVEPESGWKVYDARIIETSSSFSKLEKKLEEIALKKLGANSDREAKKRKRGERDLLQPSDTEERSRSVTPSSYTKQTNEVTSNLIRSTVMTDFNNVVEDDPAVLNNGYEEDRSRKERKKERKNRKASLEREEEEVLIKVSVLDQLLQSQNELKRMLEEANLPEMKRRISKLYGALKNKPVEKINQEQPNPISQVEIFEGTRVYVSSVVWQQACLMSSTTAFVRTLLVHLFTQEVLAASSLRGGPARNSLGDGTIHRQLDPKITDALMAAARNREPKLKKGDFGTAVNNKCGEARDKIKKASEANAVLDAQEYNV